MSESDFPVTVSATSAEADHVDDLATVVREITAYAKTTTGENLQRYSAVLDFAFRNFAQLLNAKQLREMVGGGSQTTAQAAIKQFRENLQRKLKHRLDMGADIPGHVSTLASELIGQIWSAARREAKDEFDADLAEAKTEVELAKSTAARAQADLSEAKRELEELSQAQLALSTEVDVLKEALRDAQANNTELAHQREKDQTEIERLQGDLDRMANEARRSAVAHSEALAAADTRFQAAAAQHRENIAQLGRRHDAAMERLTKSADADRYKLDKVTSELSETTLLLARTQRDAALDRERLSVVTGEVARHQQEGDRLQASLAAAEKRNEALETLLLAKGFDHAALIKWLQEGADSALPGLAGTEALVAGAVLHQIDRLRAAATPAKGGKS